ncbi:uncharacterized protein CMC5_060310 [Chondromyces crocatus]|uniref:Uncharacterized protein n=1 Tax=Chondromyces crocatus TaxID=52 RepID=A0A0K1ELP9_CHOCO|nr:uncharacterized protein CMC5_060310 [Chondromyces crocatus]
MHPVQLTYGPHGRLDAMTQGMRTISHAYFPHGFRRSTTESATVPASQSPRTPSPWWLRTAPRAHLLAQVSRFHRAIFAARWVSTVPGRGSADLSQ